MAEAVSVEDLSKHEKEGQQRREKGERREERGEYAAASRKQVRDENTAYGVLSLSLSRADARILLVSLVPREDSSTRAQAGTGEYFGPPSLSRRARTAQLQIKAQWES
jgi:hypothetical protein